MARPWDIPAATAAPIAVALLLQVLFYLVPGVPAWRARLERRFSPARIAWVAMAAAIVPYLLYSLPTGVFRIAALGKLAAIAGVVSFVFVLWPTRSPRFAWQDLVVVATVAAAELGKVFRQIYLSPVDDLRLEILGRFMILGVGATAYLSLRRLEGSGYRLWASGDDWKTGNRQFLLFMPAGAVVGLAIGFARFRPATADPWTYPLVALGTFFGMYLAVALFEELFFRGVLQNLLGGTLGSAVAAQAAASVLFGLAHLPFRAFPNWRFAILATLAGWFYGQAWRRQGSVPAAAVAHALVNTAWRVLFGG